MKNLLITALAVVVLAMTFFLIREKSFNGSPGLSLNPGAGNTANVNTDTILDLSGQGLTKVPEYIFSRTNLEELNLSNNSLGGALPSQVGNLQKLKVLNLSNNKFTGVPAEVGRLGNLEVLNLSNNELTGLPMELGNLSKLKLLDLSGNKYSESDLASIKSKLPPSVVIKKN